MLFDHFLFFSPRDRMKAFALFLVIVLNLLLRVFSTCPPGFRGPKCDEKCSMNCHTGSCYFRDEIELCHCDETKWTGTNCEVALPCATARCNHGHCEPVNHTMAQFICVCDAGYKGERCDEPTADLCSGQSRIRCENGGECEKNKCNCADGFSGTRCQNVVPLQSEYTASGCNASCAAAFGDHKCDRQCNTYECFFDGLDCNEHPGVHDDTLPWIELGPATKCLEKYGNEICDRACNLGEYGFDGGDCEKELRGGVTSKIEISLGVNPIMVKLALKYFIANLGQILRARVSISKSTKDNQPEIFSIVNSTGVEERISLDDALHTHRYMEYTKLILDVDASHCHNAKWNCLRLNGTSKTIQPAITLLNTKFVRSRRGLIFPTHSVQHSYIVLSAAAVEEPSSPGIGISVVIIISLIFFLFLSLLIIVCWLVLRHIRYSKIAKDEGTRLIELYSNY